MITKVYTAKACPPRHEHQAGRLPKPWKNGLLRSRGAEIGRVQRILDPFLIATIFFLTANAKHADVSSLVYQEAFLAILLVTATILPLGKIYHSYRQQSLFLLLRRVSTSWMQVLTVLLLLAFLTKNT
ncbi:MAG: hypothetical protein WBM08_11355, partial [Prochlorococcaceae cyanobacterium]